MASQLNLDRSDPGVDELCAGWEDGGSYRCTINITQVKSSPSMNTFDVTEIMPEETTNDTDTAPQEPAPEAPTRNKTTVPIKY